MASANTIFSLTILNVLIAILIASDILAGSSSISTTSAASIAASDPSAPIAIPISALDSTGASLIPSPAKATFSFGFLFSISFSTSATLSAGRSSLFTISIPISAATLSATAFESPVSITVFIFWFLRPSIACFVVGLITSEITIHPAYLSSTAT